MSDVKVLRPRVFLDFIPVVRLVQDIFKEDEQCADVCARGLDIKKLDIVINFDMPKELSTYVHRVGRTGRIRNGTCNSFVNVQTDIPFLEALKKSYEECGQIVPQSLTKIFEDQL